MKNLELNNLMENIRQFYTIRAWEKFHSPKNLVINLCSEMGELAEHFRWISEQESYKPTNRDEIADECADVFISLLNLADKLDINLIDASQRKLDKTAKKYPAELVNGNCQKYTKYKSHQ